MFLNEPWGGWESLADGFKLTMIELEETMVRVENREDGVLQG